MKRSWVIVLVLLGMVRTDGAQAAEPKPLIQIGAEVVEVDEQ